MSNAVNVADALPPGKSVGFAPVASLWAEVLVRPFFRRCPAGKPC